MTKTKEKPQRPKITLTTTVDKALVGGCMLVLYGRNSNTKKKSEVLKDIVIRFAKEYFTDEMKQAYQEKPEVLEYYFNRVTKRFAYDLSEIADPEDLPIPIGDRIES